MCEVCTPKHGRMSLDAQVDDDRADREVEQRQNPNGN